MQEVLQRVSRADGAAVLGEEAVSTAAGGAGPLPGLLRPALADELVPAATALLEHARQSSDNRLLMLSVQVWRQIMMATSADDSSRAGRLSNLGLALFALSCCSGVAADLDEAVECQREALAITPADAADRARQLINLTSMPRERFTSAGAEGDLHLAVAMSREAVAATPADHENRVPGTCRRLQREPLSQRCAAADPGRDHLPSAARPCLRSAGRSRRHLPPQPAHC
jgi:hypothetical protein